MKCLRLLLTLLFGAVLITNYAVAQAPVGPPCTDNNPPEDGSNGNSCVADKIGPGIFTATPFTDGSVPWTTVIRTTIS